MIPNNKTIAWIAFCALVVLSSIIGGCTYWNVKIDTLDRNIRLEAIKNGATILPSCNSQPFIVYLNKEEKTK